MVRELLSPGSEATWMAMIRSRTLISHTDNPALAQDIAGLSIPGLPESASEAILQTIGAQPQMQRVVQLDHLISHQGLRSHIQRAGRVLRDRASPLGR